MHSNINFKREFNKGKVNLCLNRIYIQIKNLESEVDFSCGSEEDEINNRFTHLALSVDNVEQAYNVALKAGAESIMEPAVKTPDSSPVRLTIHCAFVRAPGGETLEFFRILEANRCL